MTRRFYIMSATREPVALEVIGNPKMDELRAELSRVYGSGYRLGPFARRGRRQRAEVKKSSKNEVIGLVAETSRAGRNWLGGVP